MEDMCRLLVKVCEDLDILLSIIISYVQPEMVESIRSCAVAIQPDITALCLTELLAVCLGNQRTSEAEALCVVTQCAVNQFSVPLPSIQSIE